MNSKECTIHAKGVGLQSEEQFLGEFWARLAPRIAESPYSDRELSKLCGKGPNYVNAATKKQSDIGVHALYAICELLALDPSQLFGLAEKVFVADRAPKSEAEIVETLLATAQRLARMRAESDQPPTLDHILSDWRSAEQRIEKMDKSILSYCDIYAPPLDETTLNIIAIGERGLTAEAYRKPGPTSTASRILEKHWPYLNGTNCSRQHRQ